MITEENKPKRRIEKVLLKKILSIFAIIFLLLVLPITVNLALSSQDIRNKAQVISSDGATDVRIDNYNNTGNSQNNSTLDNTTNNNGFTTLISKAYPFLIGILIIIWGTIIFIYFGLKYRKKR